MLDSMKEGTAFESIYEYESLLRKLSGQSRMVCSKAFQP